jgi:hypothetical protein
MSRVRLSRKPDSASYIESLARAWTESSINTLAGLMTQPSVPPKDRIRCAEILLDRGWGKAIEHHMFGDGRETVLTKVVREIVHLDSVPREELEETDLLVEWKDMTDENANGGDHTNGGGND